MAADRFFVEGRRNTGDLVELCGGDAHKLLAVLRKGTGDRIVVIDSAAQNFDARLEIDGTHVRARLEIMMPAPRAATLSLTLAQGIPKGQKMDFVVEKATELGVARILPFFSERTVGAGPRAGKVERWRRLARSAAQQSGRSDVPDVEEPLDWSGLVARMPGFQRTLVPWELAQTPQLRLVLPDVLAGVSEVLVVIGPEGGLSHAEAEEAAAAGARLISLGPRVLRTETAGLVACSAVLYAAGDL